MPDFGADSDDGETMQAGGGAGGPDGGTPSSMIVQFATLEGENKGPQIDVPLGSTVPQMEELMNQLLENQDKVRSKSILCDRGSAVAAASKLIETGASWVTLNNVFVVMVEL